MFYGRTGRRGVLNVHISVATVCNIYWQTKSKTINKTVNWCLVRRRGAWVDRDWTFIARKPGWRRIVRLRFSRRWLTQDRTLITRTPGRRRIVRLRFSRRWLTQSHWWFVALMYNGTNLSQLIAANAILLLDNNQNRMYFMMLILKELLITVYFLVYFKAQNKLITVLICYWFL